MKKIIQITINDRLYETDGISIRLVHYHRKCMCGGGFLWVVQLSDELRGEILRKLK